MKKAKHKSKAVKDSNLEKETQIPYPARETGSGHMARKPGSHLQRDVLTDDETSNR